MLRTFQVCLFSFLSCISFLDTVQAQSIGPEIISGRILFMIENGADPDQIATDLRTIDGVNTNASILKEVSAPMRIWEMQFDHEAVPQQKMLDAVKGHRHVMLAQNDHPATFRAIPNDPG